MFVLFLVECKLPLNIVYIYEFLGMSLLFEKVVYLDTQAVEKLNYASIEKALPESATSNHIESQVI